MKKNNKGLIVLVIVLALLLLGTIGYICYDKDIFNLNSENASKEKNYLLKR